MQSGKCSDSAMKKSHRRNKCRVTPDADVLPRTSGCGTATVVMIRLSSPRETWGNDA